MPRKRGLRSCLRRCRRSPPEPQSWSSALTLRGQAVRVRKQMLQSRRGGARQPRQTSLPSAASWLHAKAHGARRSELLRRCVRRRAAWLQCETHWMQRKRHWRYRQCAAQQPLRWPCLDLGRSAAAA